MGITDGNWICNKCGEAITGCELCADDPTQKVIEVNND